MAGAIEMVSEGKPCQHSSRVPAANKIRHIEFIGGHAITTTTSYSSRHAATHRSIKALFILIIITTQANAQTTC
ncbi:hypothetical protein MUCCIDRAFT_115962 [Mucor lusitanicus CBS 277.49]|uniref:Uncharacterized protein n=1 Tax=Mucor lusitanicus CBS 277.49 TaxID=747725 RepID=A0A168GNV6_MUCCL|nr:hypothetical protein MUCCIDRAFT_115962 [Mucor lusitanicus CBS 277.49]